MKIEEYKEIIKKTSVYPETVDNFALAYGYIGLLDELNELSKESQKDKAIKEIGDVFWYITLISDIVELDIEDIFTNKAVNNISIGDIAGDIKKFYRDNKPIDKDKLIDVLKSLVDNIKFIYKLSYKEILDIENVLEINYNKLTKRLKDNTIQGDGSER